MARLAEDEASLDIVDALWQEQPSQTAVHNLPDLEPDRAQQMRRQLIKQIHRADLAVHIVKMGTTGFVSVALGLLRPLLNNKNQDRKNRKRGRGND